MKSMLKIVTILGLSHLLAVLGVVGWLGATQRLSTERLESIREILHEPMPVAVARLAEEAKQAEAEAVTGEEQPEGNGVPLSAQAALQMHLQEQDMHRERIARLQREVSDLKGLLIQMRQKLNEERAAFKAELEAFEQTRAELQLTEGQEQFRKALGLLSGLKADKAKILLDQLIRDGTFEGDFADQAGSDMPSALRGIDQAVSYLNEMPSRQSAKILDEFIDADPALANELLERLRTRGQVALASEG